MIDSKFIGHSLSWTTVDGWFTYTFIYTLGRIRCVLRFIRTSKKNSLKSTSESKIKKFEKNVAHWINFDGNSFFWKDEYKVRLITKEKWQIIWTVCAVHSVWSCLKLMEIIEDGVNDASTKKTKMREKSCYLKRHPRWMLSISVFTVHCQERPGVHSRCRFFFVIVVLLKMNILWWLINLKFRQRNNGYQLLLVAECQSDI